MIVPDSGTILAASRSIAFGWNAAGRNCWSSASMSNVWVNAPGLRSWAGSTPRTSSTLALMPHTAPSNSSRPATRQYAGRALCTVNTSVSEFGPASRSLMSTSGLIVSYRPGPGPPLAPNCL